MKQSFKIVGIVFITVVLTSVATSYFVRKGTIRAFTDEVSAMEATNDVGRVEAYDRIEALLIKGCNKEALETVRIEQSSMLSAIRYEMEGSSEVMQRVKQRNANMVERAMKVSAQTVTYLPQCK